MGNSPAKLYKYRKIWNKNDLSRCPNIKALFDCYGMINSRKKFEDQEDSRIHLINPSKNVLIKLIKAHPNHKPRLESYAETGVFETLNIKFNEMIDRYGIYCFSSIGNNYRMWNQYAENHTGFCIEFIREGFFQGKIVEYQEKIASMNMLPFIKNYLGIDDNDNKLGKTVHRLLHVKLGKWRFENEYRFIETGMLPDRLMYEKPYSKSSVLSVIFGKDMEPQHRKFIMENMRSKGFEIEFKEAKEVGFQKIEINRLKCGSSC